MFFIGTDMVMIIW